MPTLIQDRPTTTVDLPISKGKVEIYNYLLAGEERTIQTAYLKGSGGFKPGTEDTPTVDINEALSSQDILLKSSIASWDFTDANGGVVGISAETLAQLPKDDYEFLCAKVLEIQKPDEPAKGKKKT